MKDFAYDSKVAFAKTDDLKRFACLSAQRKQPVPPSSPYGLIDRVDFNQ